MDLYDNKSQEYTQLKEKYDLQEVDDEVAELNKLIKSAEKNIKKNQESGLNTNYSTDC